MTLAIGAEKLGVGDEGRVYIYAKEALEDVGRWRFGIKS
jgi:protein involved in polysaccharide export with SLBB domain